MPLSQYARYFGGQKDAPARVLARLRKEYGQEKGTRVFYALIAKRRSARERGTGLSRRVRDRRR